jgi:hypothetical protein
MPAINIFEAECDPPVVVIRPQQARHRGRRRQGRHDPCLATVHPGRIGIGHFADRLDEYPPPIVQEEPGGKPWREAAGLGNRFDDLAIETLFDCISD